MIDREKAILQIFKVGEWMATTFRNDWTNSFQHIRELIILCPWFFLTGFVESQAYAGDNDDFERL